MGLFSTFWFGSQHRGPPTKSLFGADPGSGGIIACNLSLVGPEPRDKNDPEQASKPHLTLLPHRFPAVKKMARRDGPAAGTAAASSGSGSA
jgi:hypothetical protein